MSIWFFMKATQLEQMNTVYIQVQKNKEITLQLIESKEQILQKMRSEVKVWEYKFRNLAAISDLNIKVKTLKQEMAWAEVAERERELKPLEKNLQAEEAALPSFNSKVDQTKNLQEECKEHHKALQQRLIDYSKEIQVFEQILQAKKAEVNQVKDILEPIMNQLKTIERDLTITIRECQQCQDRIEELKTRQFFMKATQLEQMNTVYIQVQKNKEITLQLIESKEQILQKMRSEVKVWEYKFRNLAAISDLNIKVKTLKQEMAWAEVAERERELKPLEKNLQAEEAALPSFNSKVDQTKNLQEECKEHHKALQQRLIDYSKEIQVFEQILQAKKAEVNQAKDILEPIMNQLKTIERDLTITIRECQQCQDRIEELKTRQNQLKTIERDLTITIRECQQCQDRIEELKTRASHDYENERCQREQQIAHLEKNLLEMQSSQKVKEHEIDQYRSAVAKYKSDVGQFEQQLKNKHFKLREIKTSILTLKAATNDRLKRFGANMPKIIKKIQSNAGNFHQLPKGPLAACFDVLDPKLALAIECCLKDLENSFVCHDHHDEKVLDEILKSFRGPQPTIITSPFSDQVHDVSSVRAKSKKYPCVLDVIKSDDPVVINTLIDQCGIMNVLLIEDSNEARSVMMRDPPENAKGCFTIMGDKALSFPTFRYYSSDRTAVKYLMADVKDQIVKLKQEESQLKADIKDITQQKTMKAREITTNQQEERKSLTQLNKLAESISQCAFEIGELRNVEDPTPVDVTTLEEEVLTYNKKIQELRALLETVEENRVRRCLELHVRIAKRWRKTFESDQVEKHKKDIEDDQKKAQQICDRIETRRSVNNIESEITQIERLIEEEEKQQGNEAAITQTYKAKKDKLETVKREVGQLRNYIDKLSHVIENRQAAYIRMRNYIASRTKYFFLVQMFQRSYTEKMNFDFDKQTLDILVNTAQNSPSKKGAGGKAKNVESLSGGERSFSTVCFILSLWEAMESPFRCLDEFDVFMDMVNRRISMDMMMETADMHKNMQFIFLTPQDMSSVKKISDVRIFRMPDPERTENQATLQFSQNSAS